ncbi:hypothetical protein GBA52_020671 [Prunus armeniaca]|nr:hypothetical protein GBA52_020671 [Prunus armeniaca]
MERWMLSIPSFQVMAAVEDQRDDVPAETGLEFELSWMERVGRRGGRERRNRFTDTKPVKIEDVGVQKEGFGVKEEKIMGQVTVALRIGLPNSTSEADQSDTHHENKKVLDLNEDLQ